MNFSDFAQILYPYIGDNRGQADYVYSLTCLIMAEPSTPEDVTADENDQYYPLSSLQPNALSKIYTGERNISKKSAGVIYGHIDKTDFIDKIYSLPVDAKENLQNELEDQGVNFGSGSLEDICADIFEQLMLARSKGQEEIALSVSPTRDKKGRKITEVPLASAYMENGKLHIGGESIELPTQLLVADEIAVHEQKYIDALFEAYAEVLNRDSVCKDDIPTFSKRYREHFSDQRKYYYSAESIQRSVREVYDDGEKQFSILKEDAYEGIKEVYWGTQANGYERLEAVLIKITSTTLDKSALSHIKNLIGNLEKKGICHILVNDGTIASWVNIDD